MKPRCIICNEAAGSYVTNYLNVILMHCVFSWKSATVDEAEPET